MSPVRSVLRCLLDDNVFVKAEKNEFHVSSAFLDYIIAKDSLKMDPAKVSAVASWPVSETRKQLQQFLGFANFYWCFIMGFNLVAASLSALMSSKTTIN